MSETIHEVNTKTITELTQQGAALTGDFEEVLLHDPLSLVFKEHQSALINQINEEIDLEHLAQLLQQENLMLDKFEANELAEKQAIANEKQKNKNQESNETHEGSEKSQHELTPTKIILPGVLEVLSNFLSLSREIVATEQALQHVQQNQHMLRQQWMTEQQQQANELVQTLKSIPVLLPNGTAIPNLSLQFNPASPEALALKDRLAAAPMMTDLLNRLEQTDMRLMYDKQVKIQAQKIQAANPETNSEELELAARQEAIKVLNLNVRQLQNRFLLSVTAIHDYLKKLGTHHIDNLVQQYNNALGIDANAAPHKKMGIYKILQHAISPYLAPKLTMENRKNNRDELENQHLQINAMRGTIQEQRLQQQNLARLSTVRALIATLRHVAIQNADFAFLNDICDRVASPSPRIPTRKNIFRLVPKGYNI
jgi:hypothetical protein